MGRIERIAFVPSSGLSNWIVRWKHPSCPSFHEESAVARTPEEAALYFKKVVRKLKSLRCGRRRVRTEARICFVRPDPLVTLRAFLATTAGQTWASGDPARALSYLALYADRWPIFDVEPNHRCVSKESSGPVVLIYSYHDPLQTRCAACGTDVTFLLPWPSGPGLRNRSR